MKMQCCVAGTCLTWAQWRASTVLAMSEPTPEEKQDLAAGKIAPQGRQFQTVGYFCYPHKLEDEKAHPERLYNFIGAIPPDPRWS